MRYLFRQPRPATGPRNPTHPGWMEYTSPLIVGDHTVQLRPLMKSDGEPWSELRLADADILARVEPTIHTSWAEAHSSARWREFYNNIRRAADDGVLIPFAIDVDGEFCGQVTLGSIAPGFRENRLSGRRIFAQEPAYFRPMAGSLSDGYHN